MGRIAGRRPRARIPSLGLVLAAMVSVQIGAAVARRVFAEASPPGLVLLRLVFGSAALLLVSGKQIRVSSRRELASLAAFAVTIGCMNLSFYGAIDRIPLGIAVTLEFVGPLTVAIIGSRRRLDALWVGLAAAGVILLTGSGAGAVRPVGVALALSAGALWAVYIVLSARIGGMFPGGSGLALAMAGAAVVVAPVGATTGGHNLLRAHVLVVGLAVGVLSSAIPWSCELEALRRIPTHVFGVLMSIEPAIAALAGVVILGQHLRTLTVLAIVLVIAASAGASWSNRVARAGGRRPVAERVLLEET
jgi:inner membrane transporter RhtA